MKQPMRQRKSNVEGWMAGVCCLLMAMCGVRSAIAQQGAGAMPIATAASAPAMDEPEVSAFVSAQFSALMPGVAAARPAAGPAVADEEESSNSSKPGAEGIKIHGHWVLQVKNPDGTLGERREFNNSLITTYTPTKTASGSAILAAILSGNIAVADPAIAILQGPLTGDPSTYCFLPAAAVSAGCYLFTDSGSFFSASVAYSDPGATTGPLGGQLGMLKTVTFTPTASIGLTGNFIVPAGLTSISGVQSIYSGCISEGFNTSNSAFTAMSGVTGFGSADHASSTCIAGAGSGAAFSTIIGTDFPWGGALTSAALPGGPMTVTPGQILSITFTLSFS